MKKILKHLYKYWMVFARFLGRINSRILLTIFYFIIFGLVAVIRKIFKYAIMKPKKASYWLNKKAREDKDYEQQF